jgi:hypothetical protein
VRVANLMEESHTMEDAAASQNGTYPFTTAELERLDAFRQAVRAGFYTDEIDVWAPTSDSSATPGNPQLPSAN